MAGKARVSKADSPFAAAQGNIKALTSQPAHANATLLSILTLCLQILFHWIHRSFDFSNLADSIQQFLFSSTALVVVQTDNWYTGTLMKLA